MSRNRLEWLNEAPAGSNECVMCGRPATHRYYGFPCCCPYGDDGRVVCRCKWNLSNLIIREQERERLAYQLEIVQGRGD